MEIKSIKQSDLSSECWLIQMFGLSSCKNCEAFDTDDCGGKEILKNGFNEKGIDIPLQDQTQKKGKENDEH